ncbi:MAG: ATP-binding protein [Candidatus Obscuribacterales bacterium]|nr:ATP-binding protein [Candidatus Obscuribacterales bacterium]
MTGTRAKKGGAGGSSAGKKSSRSRELDTDERSTRGSSSGNGSGNPLESLLGGLPPMLRELLPFSTGSGQSDQQEQKGPPKDKRNAASWQDICFIHSIPGEDDDEGLLVLADGSMRKFISCKGINALLFDEADRDRLARDFANMANTIDSDIQVLVTSRNLSIDEYLSRYQNQIKTDNEYLRWYADYTDKWFRRIQDVHFVPQRDFYIVVSYQPPDAKTGAWNGKRSVQKHEEFLEDLNRYVKTVSEQLRTSQLRPNLLTRREMRNLIYAHLNPTLSETEQEAPPSRPGISEASCLARSGLKVTDKYLWLDGKYVGTMYMQQIPHETWMGWLVDLLTLSVEYTASFFIHCCDQDDVRKRLKRQYTIGLVANNQLATPDLEGQEATRSAQAAIQEFLRSSNKAFDISFYIKTHADTEERLTGNLDEIRRVFKNRGALLDRAQLLQLDAWQSTLPVGVDKLAVVQQVMSPIVGSFWPFFTASCGTPDGVPFGFAIASREPVLLNPFFRGAGKDANNMFVVGTTGAGKSFAVSMMILRLLPLGVRFVLIDKTVDKFGAYRFITELLGPEFCAYIDLGPSSGYILNPFDIGQDDGKPGEPNAEKISTLLSLLDLMLTPEGREELHVEEKSLLDGLIRVAYMDAAFRGTIPTMSDLARVTAQAAADEIDPLQRDRLQQFARGLSLFTRSGAFGGLVDGLTNIDSEKLFIVFDTREVNDPRLERIASFILADFIRRKAAESKKRNIRFAAVIDEAATLMRFKAGARLLDDLSRRARHYGMMLVTITQQLKDFFRQSELADSVVKNAHMKILLRQDPSDLRMLQETLRLTDAEKSAIDSFAQDTEKRRDSQCLLIVGSIHGTIRLVPNPMDYWVCTSEPINDIPKRRAMIEEVKAKNPKINHTDACRQAVYYLGLQFES